MPGRPGQFVPFPARRLGAEARTVRPRHANEGTVARGRGELPASRPVAAGAVHVTAVAVVFAIVYWDELGQTPETVTLGIGVVASTMIGLGVTNALAARNSALERPPCVAKAPISMNSGMAISR